MKSRYILALGALGLAAFGLMVYHDINATDCGMDVYGTLPSPDGQYKAVAFGVDCGATTGFNTQVSIFPANVSFDRDAYPPILILDDKWTLHMRWHDSARLLVTVPSTAQIYRKEDRAGEISISYD